MRYWQRRSAQKRVILHSQYRSVWQTYIAVGNMINIIWRTPMKYGRSLPVVALIYAIPASFYVRKLVVPATTRLALGVGRQGYAGLISMFSAKTC